MKKTIVIWLVMFMVSGSAVVVGATPIAYWSCDDPIGSMTLTESIGGVDGSLNGSISFIPSPVGYGNAVSSAHRNNYISFAGDSWSLGTSDITIVGWFNAAGLQPRHGNVITLGGWNSGGFEITVLKDADVDGIQEGNEGMLQFTVFSGGGISGDNKYVASDNSMADSQWHWFAGVVSSQTISLYIDGVLQLGSNTAYGTTTTASTTGTTGYIVRNQVMGADELAVFGTALSAELNGTALVGGELYEAWQNGVPEPATLLLLACGSMLISRKRN